MMVRAGAGVARGAGGAGGRGSVRQGDRAKAYRPIDVAARSAALHAGIAAYERGDFFEAHELLEPAWMGTADVAERDLYQGLIKLAAGFVHAVRGNPLGVEKNLRGARERLARSAAAGTPIAVAEAETIDVDAIVAAIDDRLATLAGGAIRAGNHHPFDPSVLVPPVITRRFP